MIPAVELPTGTIAFTGHGHSPRRCYLHGPFMNHTVWDAVLPHLAGGYRIIRPDVPLGAHRHPMPPGADPGLRGLVQLLAGFLDALDWH